MSSSSPVTSFLRVTGLNILTVVVCGLSISPADVLRLLIMPSH